MSAPSPAAAARADSARATMSFELLDGGEPVEIELPPSDEVVEGESPKLGG